MTDQAQIWTSSGGRSSIRDLSTYAELLWFLALRNIRLRYKNTAFGFAWVLAQPLLLASIAILVFGRLQEFRGGTDPYSLFVLTGLVIWQYFARVVTSVSESIVRDERLISKVYFPRLLLPMSALVSCVFDLVVTLPLILVAGLILGGSSSTPLLLAPLPLLMVTALGFGLGLVFSALNLAYRDVQHGIPFLLQIWFFATPVVYPVDILPPSLSAIAGLNPVAPHLEMFRWAVFGFGAPPGFGQLLISVLVPAGLLALGMAIFRRLEPTFADGAG